MSCKLEELKKELRASAVKGMVDGIPVDVAVMRLTMMAGYQQANKLSASVTKKVNKGTAALKGYTRPEKAEKPEKAEEVKKVEEPKVQPAPAQERMELGQLVKLPNGAIQFKKGEKTTVARKVITDLGSLLDLGKDYTTLLGTVAVDGASKVSNPKTTHTANMFAMLKRANIPFNPLTVEFKEGHSGGTGTERGWALRDDTITMYYGAAHTGANPAQVLLHEYTHIITQVGLDKNPDLQAKTDALLEHVKKNWPEGTVKPYGLTNAKEFLAEAIASPKFQEVLAAIPAMESKGVLATIKEIFKELLDSLTNKQVAEVNALTEALELVIEVAEAQQGKAADVKIEVAEMGDQIGDDKILEARWQSLKTDAERIAMLKELNGPMGKDGSTGYLKSLYKIAREDWLTGIPFYKEVADVLPKGSVQYHISDGKFKKFAVAGETVDDWTFNTLGSHIGSAETVQNYEGQQSWGKGKVKYKVTVNDDVKTLTMKDPGDSNWTAENMHDQLEEEYDSVPFTKDADAKEVLDFLRGKGIDAIKYENTEESGVSYMVLNPDKFTLDQIEEFPGAAKAMPTKGKAQLDPAIIKQVEESKDC